MRSRAFLRASGVYLFRDKRRACAYASIIVKIHMAAESKRPNTHCVLRDLGSNGSQLVHPTRAISSSSRASCSIVASAGQQRAYLTSPREQLPLRVRWSTVLGEDRTAARLRRVQRGTWLLCVASGAASASALMRNGYRSESSARGSWLRTSPLSFDIQLWDEEGLT